MPRARIADDPLSRQLTALADPTRRAVFEIVRSQPSSVAAVTRQLPISQPAVSQHLKVLAAAGLVAATPDGARRIYRAEGRSLAPLRSWIDQMWDEVLDAFVDAARSQGPAARPAGHQPSPPTGAAPDQPRGRP